MAQVKLTQVMKTVTLAGTAEALTATSKLVVSIMIQAEATNTGKIFVGDSDVSSVLYAGCITAGNTLTIEPPVMGGAGAFEFDLSTIYIDSEVNTDGVSVAIFVRS